MKPLAPAGEARTTGEPLKDFVCVLYPGLILLVFIPFSIFLPNQETVGSDVTLFAPFAVGLGAWAAVALAMALLRQRRLATLFLVLGHALLLRDILTPVRASGLVGLDPSIIIAGAPLVQIGAEILLIAVMLYALWRVPAATLRAVLFPIAVAFLATQALYIPAKINWRALRSGERTAAPPAAAPIPAGAPHRGNIYLICLDSFIGSSFPAAVRDANLTQDFAGFVYYPNHRSNYTFTWPSIAGALGGGMHRVDAAGEWYERSVRHDGLMGSAAAAGYATWQYGGPGDQNDHVPPERFRPRPERISKSNRRNYALQVVWVTRIAPVALRKSVWSLLTKKEKESWFLSVSDLIVNSLSQMRTFADDEATRPAYNQFVFAHFYIPHKPFAFDAECNELSSEGTYLPQATCSLRPLASWLHTLRAKGAFDDAAIVIFSDHGQIGRGTTPFMRLLKDRDGSAPPELLVLANTLLLFKPPAGRRVVSDLAVDLRYTQTLDIAATIVDSARLGVDEPGGSSLLEPAVDNPRIEVFDKFGDLYTLLKRRRTEFDTIEADLDRWVFSPREGWRLEGKVRTRW